MPRARISAQGLEIAKQGYDVDTAAPENMAFDKNYVALRLAYTGVLTVVNFSGFMSDKYRQAIFVFPTPFLKPPLCMVAGQRSDGATDQTTFLGIAASDQSNMAWHEPVYQIITTTTQMELYVSKTSWGNNASRTVNWRYWVFRNTLED
ncbi:MULTISPECIES: hypothetical protein [unclassified Mesorhizobium]|uniref:hypothetical protein n=1 Tax=unclassified Mesorhizobium TaxID=325217 RepID=UPI000FD6BA4A|nr:MULTISPECIES: hypothetical protein [unclassified Mesorhizobium]TGT64103.1 hypothetical protein EN809_035185 [Mesorhizobium sp. M2E.F.Ca.ET.166.01.1.1]TGV97014.1 hypothetical protein EN797_034980 [Mesorhizobium sp. M2E.F.Ca.ET.154.01.1.1]